MQKKIYLCQVVSNVSMFSQETLNQDFIKMTKGDVPPNKFYTLPKAQIRKEETINRPAKRAKRSKPLKAFD